MLVAWNRIIQSAFQSLKHSELAPWSSCGWLPHQHVCMAVAVVPSILASGSSALNLCVPPAHGWLPFYGHNRLSLIVQTRHLACFHTLPCHSFFPLLSGVLSLSLCLSLSMSTIPLGIDHLWDVLLWPMVPSASFQSASCIPVSCYSHPHLVSAWIFCAIDLSSVQP